MRNERTTTRKLLRAALAASLLLLGAGTAAAEDGVSVVMAKDVTAGTVSLDGGTVLHVDERTVIRNEQGKRIALAELPTAEPVGGGWQVDGDETVRYEAVRRGGKLRASEIEVLGAPLD